MESTCPGCGVPTEPTLGRRAYCLPCSEASTGETLGHLQARAARGMTKRAYGRWAAEQAVAARARRHRNY